jgi:biopolymer transport protein ExbB/TolQ
LAKKPLSRNGWGLLISGIIAVVAPVVGLLSTVLFLRGAFHANASVPPSDKARVLADGISGAMNGTALGLGVSLIAVVFAVVFAVRLIRERRESR